MDPDGGGCLIVVAVSGWGGGVFDWGCRIRMVGVGGLLIVLAVSGGWGGDV